MKKTRYRNGIPTICRILGIILGISFCLAQLLAQENTGMTPIVRYESGSEAAASAMSFQFVIKNWIIDGNQTIEQFPERGFLVIQLRGGELATIINGERQERHEDEFWSVPDGIVMGLETEDDSAVIQTVSILRN